MIDNRGITVIDVMRELRIEPVPELTWAIGAAVRDRYERLHGRLPEKELRTKTSGGGSHCFATYPQDMRTEIANIIRLHQLETQKQGELF